MAKSKVYRRNGAQSNGQHAYRKVANVGRLELRARGRCREFSLLAAAPLSGLNILVIVSIRGMQMEVTGRVSRKETMHPLSLLQYMGVDTTTTGPRRAGAHRPSLVPEAVNLTRPSHLSPNSDQTPASTRRVLALPDYAAKG